jgi:hypothetical protein
MATIALIALQPTFAAAIASSTTTLTAGVPIAAGLFAAAVDSMVIMPALFPAESPEGPKFDDLRLQSGSEGAPANLVFGDDTRVSGTVVWYSDLRNIGTSGGKGGGFQPDVPRKKCDVAIAICMNETESLERIWGDGLLIVDKVPSVNFENTDIGASRNANREMLYQPVKPFEDMELAKIQVNYDATISGFARQSTFTNSQAPPLDDDLLFKGAHSQSAAYITLDYNEENLTGTLQLRDSFTITHPIAGLTRYHIVEGDADPGVNEEFYVRISPALVENVADNTSVTIESGNNGTYNVLANYTTSNGLQQRVVVDNYNGHDSAAGDSVTITQTAIDYVEGRLEAYESFTGTDYQAVSSVLEAWTTDDKLPAGRGVTYVVLEGLELTDFGNRLPNFTFKVTANSSETFGSAATTLLDQAQLPSEYYDTSNVESAAEPVEGYSAQGVVSTANALTPPMIRANILAREEDGVLTFYPRDEVPSQTIDADDLGAANRGDHTDYPLGVSDRDDFDLPKEIHVKFIDPAMDYQAGSVTERVHYGTGDSAATVNLGMTLAANSARTLAKRLLWTPRINRQRVNLSLPPSYIGIGENERLTVTAMDNTWTVLTQRVDRGVNGLIEVEGIVEEDAAMEFTFVPESAPESGQGQYLRHPAPAYGVFLDLPPLSDEHVSQPGFYYALTSWQPGPWSGAVIYNSQDGGSTFEEVARTSSKATVGFATTALADAATEYWDRVSTVTVELLDGELESATEAAVLNGANRAYLGGEIIGYKTATLGAARTYTLSTLLRGLRDTGSSTSTHAIADEFVLLDDAIGWQPLNTGDLGAARSYKVVASGSYLANVTASSETFEGITTRPFKPAHVKAETESNDDITITWVERTRRIVRLLSEEGAPPVETMAYEVDIMDASTVLRTLSVDATTATYTSAQQSTDLDAADTARVYQVSPTTGRGTYTEVTLP